jgi:hypothetical protein
MLTKAWPLTYGLDEAPEARSRAVVPDLMPAL